MLLKLFPLNLVEASGWGETKERSSLDQARIAQRGSGLRLRWTIAAAEHVPVVIPFAARAFR